MRIGILGSGLMGGKLGTIFARAGHEVALTLIFIGIHNAWDAVAYLAVQHRSQPPE